MFRTLIAVLISMPLLLSLTSFACGTTLLPAPDMFDKWGYVDAANGQVIVEPRYTRAGMFRGGFAVVHMSFPAASYSVFTLDGEQVDVFPKGDGILNEEGFEILPVVNGQFVNPAHFAAVDKYEEDGVLPGLFEVENIAGRGVFDGERGWVLEPGAYENIKFFSDGSFVIDGGTYWGAAPERDIFFAPAGYLIIQVDLKSQSFLLQKKSASDRSDAGGQEQTVEPSMAISSWSGEFLTRKPYKNLQVYPACSRWAGLAADGSMDIFDASGTILRELGTSTKPQALFNTIIFSNGREFVYLEPCSLRDQPTMPSSAWRNFEEPEHKVLLRDNKVLLLDHEGNELIPPLYEVLLPAGEGYWWGRYEADRWILINSADGQEVRMP